MTTPVIRVENLGKRYRIGTAQKQSQNLQTLLINWVGSPLRYLKQTLSEPTPEELIWALKEVSFEVQQGEIVGIIGRNGAGKSTLLKILSRITEPTVGYAEMRGQVASLLEVGTGFHPELTGRENVYLNGTIMGMKRWEIDRKFDEIVDFAGIEKFIDTPVKRYSSGMYVRLAFAVAAHLEPEILIVDEVLAVGDAEFQRKCLGKMQDVTTQGRTVLFVSHNMAAVRSLCGRSLLLERGQVAWDGETNEALGQYLDRQVVMNGVAKGEALQEKARSHLFQGKVFFQCHEIALLNQAGESCTCFRSDEDIIVSIIFECFQAAPTFQMLVKLVDHENTVLLQSEFDDIIEQPAILQPGIYHSQCILPQHSFGERRFYLSVSLFCQNIQHLSFRQVLYFDVEFSGYRDKFSSFSKDAYFRPQLNWHTDRCSSWQPDQPCMS
ncbi:polysaccharide ABC transporter ATP-binding protein [Neosynechococcus sphagnicola]|uniref:ABC transporter ATP-binding protein n=1 Tax=Neosynechococcus sphagnicola TaxID=1501145 RepID=UPI00069255E3|nr:polysaccharide ABC transporter ATP-binding protein [Neosynechococcus sphagnicola]